MYQEVLQELSTLWKVAVRERNEASERLQNSLEDLSKIQQLVNDILLSQDQQLLHYSDNHFFGDTITSQFIASPAISDSCSYVSSSNQISLDVEKIRDYENVVLEFIGGVLPENGKFRQAVSKATAKVESQFITGTVPKWRNHPVHVLAQRPVLSNDVIGYSNTGKWISGGLEFGSGMLNRSFPCKKARFSLMS